MKKFFRFLSRALFSILFLFSAVEALMHWQATLDGYLLHLSHWGMHLGSYPIGAQLFKWLIDHLSGLALVMTFLQLFGGAFILFGVKVSWGAFCLILFLLLVSILFHPFWFEIGVDREREIAAFLKNLAFIGAALLFLTSPKPQKSHP